ncbi:hypothetical protein AK812_SmicGene19202 [Symbiodinium microadriaticum]|uniref:Uncharacterized protein n=1 Tax=Symbiodinium microadriaticum TaxID=2951 RepID=A0A1Q9DT70_SYMMI|nr:hypothetical protein AK812_SmicGene19202 [Symbiodinium microadriaticum]
MMLMLSVKQRETMTRMLMMMVMMMLLMMVLKKKKMMVMITRIMVIMMMMMMMMVVMMMMLKKPSDDDDDDDDGDDVDDAAADETYSRLQAKEPVSGGPSAFGLWPLKCSALRRCVAGLGTPLEETQYAGADLASSPGRTVTIKVFEHLLQSCPEEADLPPAIMEAGASL